MKENKFQNLLYKLAGADIEILNLCPEEKNKFIGTGMILIMTSLFTFISIGYLTYMVSGNLFFSILGGFIGGILTFLLDRLFVSAIYDRNFKNRFFKALPGLFIAVVVGFIISIPIQLRIFEVEILEYLFKNKISDSLLARLSAIQELEKETTIFKWVSWNITTLFIILEASPVLTKVISNFSSYDELLERKMNMRLIESELEVTGTSKNKIKKLSTTDKIRYKIESGEIKGAIDDLFYRLEKSNSIEDEKRLLVAASKIKHLRNQIVHNTIEADIGNQELNKLYKIVIELSYELEKKGL